MPRWINDKDKPLINFYQQMRDDPSFISRFLRLKRRILGHADRTATAFEEAKRKFTVDGVSYLLLRRLAVRHVVRESQRNTCTMAYSFVQDRSFLASITKAKLERWREILRDVRITCLDYRDVLKSPRDGTIVFGFFDPPYWVQQSKDHSGGAVYDHIMSQAEHLQLRDRLAALDSKRFMFLMTIDDCELTHQLYGMSDEFYVFDRSVPYEMMGHGKKRIVNELVVSDYAL